MRVRASLVVSLIAAVVTTTPAGAAPPRISVDNVDSLQVVDTYDLGAARAYRFAIDREDLYLTEYVRTGDMARILRVDLDSGRILWSIDVSCTIGGPELGRQHRAVRRRAVRVQPAAEGHRGAGCDRQDGLDRRRRWGGPRWSGGDPLARPGVRRR